MALVLIKNTRPHQLSLNHGSEHAIIPPQKVLEEQDENGAIKGTKKLPGEAHIEDSLIQELYTKHKVVQHYFDEGWLVGPKDLKLSKVAKA